MFGRDFTPFFVGHLKSEVTQDPHEEGEVALGVVDAGVGFYLDLFRQVNNQGDVIKRLFIDLPNAVVQVQRAEEQRKQKNPRVMCTLLINSSKSLSIYDQNFHVLMQRILTLQSIRP